MSCLKDSNKIECRLQCSLRMLTIIFYKHADNASVNDADNVRGNCTANGDFKNTTITVKEADNGCFKILTMSALRNTTMAVLRILPMSFLRMIA